MKVSEALSEGRAIDLGTLPRYGYTGSLDDTEAVVAWLREHPLVDTEVPEEKKTVTPLRPDQARFHDQLSEAYGGRCAITGSGIARMLDAAHIRSWRQGNSVADGILMRVDLHRLFDTNPRELWLEADYVVRVVPELRDELPGIDGTKLRLPKRRQDWPVLSHCGRGE